MRLHRRQDGLRARVQEPVPVVDLFAVNGDPQLSETAADPLDAPVRTFELRRHTGGDGDLDGSDGAVVDFDRRHQRPPFASAPPTRRSSRVARFFFTSGHSEARMLYMTESRTEPSGRILWCRSTPSLRAPSASIARCDAKLKLSVRNPTTRQPSVSNAWPSSRSLQAVLTWERCQRFAYQV